MIPAFILVLLVALTATLVAWGVILWQRRPSEERLDASERSHRELIDGAPDAIFIQTEGRFAYVNAACLRLVGANGPGDLVGRPVLERFHPAYHDSIRERIYRLNQSRQAVELIEEAVVSLAGDVVPVEVSAVPFVFEGKAGAVVFMRDISARKQAEDAVSKHLTMLARTERIAEIGSWEWDVQDDEVRWSDELFRIMGLKAGKPAPSFPELSRFFVAEDFELLQRAVEACLKSGVPYEIELRAMRTDGTIRHCIAHGQPERDAGGRVDRLVGFLQDVTERRRMEERERRLVAAVEQSFEAILITDPAGAIEYVNPAFERTTGYSRNEVIGQKTSLLKSGKQGQPFYEALWTTIAGGRNWHGRMVNKRKDGTLYAEESTISPVFDGTGTIINYVAVKHDVSERERMEAEREELQSQFYQAQKMESVGRLAGGVAHDFNNMLSVMLGHAELAMSKMSPADPVCGDLREISTAARRSVRITQQLLAFARKQTIHPVTLDLNDAIEGTLKMLRRLIGEDIDLAWLPGAGLWPVLMDPGQIDQILVNLCVNARDAIGGVGKVTIETENVDFDESYCASHAGFAPGEFVLLAVSDDGCGMDRAIREKVFEPFFTTKGPGESTGLGLSTVYGIVKQNDGFINIYSEPQKGTTFRVYLARHAGTVDEPEDRREDVIARGAGETVLFVEDEPAILSLGRSMLESLGYDVRTAATPAEALQICREHDGQIDLLISDVVMPEMNGRELADRLLDIRPTIGTLFMSGYTADVIAHRGVLGEGVNFMQKPFSIKDLAAKVRGALEDR